MINGSVQEADCIHSRLPAIEGNTSEQPKERTYYAATYDKSTVDLQTITHMGVATTQEDSNHMKVYWKYLRVYLKRSKV